MKLLLKCTEAVFQHNEHSCLLELPSRTGPTVQVDVSPTPFIEGKWYEVEIHETDPPKPRHWQDWIQGENA